MTSVSSLTEKERRNAISKTVISLFAACKNQPSTINDLHESYSAMKGGIEVRREGPPKDKTSSIRSYISQWNKMAKSMDLPRHTSHDNGCTQMKPHRVCRKRVPKVGNVYWLNEALFTGIRNEHDLLKPCFRSKRAHRKNLSESSISTQFKTSCNVNLPQRSHSFSYPHNMKTFEYVPPPPVPQVGLMADFNKWSEVPKNTDNSAEEDEDDSDIDLDFPEDDDTDSFVTFDSMFVNMSQFHLDTQGIGSSSGSSKYTPTFLNPYPSELCSGARVELEELDRYTSEDTFSTCSSPPPDFDTFVFEE
jgi:hypothetical protein